MSTILRIGTRGSRLALWQAHFVQDKLQELGVTSDLVVIKTQGDQVQHLGFDKLEGKGFFTREIEQALLAGTVDLAVHSMKDMPTTQPDGLCLAAVSERADPADWLLVNPGRADEAQVLGLPLGARVGTSSARRKAQLLAIRPDLQLIDIRGNVPTRTEKARTGAVDAVMLAAAGLLRLEMDLSDLHVVRLSPRELVPAPAQGVLTLQTRVDAIVIRRLLRRLHHPSVAACTNVERRVLQLLQGGCHMPLGVHCQVDDHGHYHVWAAVADEWSGPVQRARISSATTHQLAETVVSALQTAPYVRAM